MSHLQFRPILCALAFACAHALDAQRPSTDQLIWTAVAEEKEKLVLCGFYQPDGDAIGGLALIQASRTRMVIFAAAHGRSRGWRRRQGHVKRCYRLNDRDARLRICSVGGSYRPAKFQACQASTVH